MLVCHSSNPKFCKKKIRSKSRRVTNREKGKNSTKIALKILFLFKTIVRKNLSMRNLNNLSTKTSFIPNIKLINKVISQLIEITFLAFLPISIFTPTTPTIT